MVKKIGGIKTSGAGPVQPTQASEASKVGGVGQVGATTEQARVGRVRRPTRPMTAAERDHLFNLIHEEADKMFGANGLPESQRNTLENAVRMTVDASIVEEGEEEGKE